MNIDKRLAKLERCASPECECFDLHHLGELKGLIRSVIRSVKPARLTSNLEHIHKAMIRNMGITPIATDMYAYNAAIDDMEAKMVEVGL